MPTVLVPTAYRGPTQGQSEIVVAGATVRACLEAVESQYPNFIRQVLDDALLGDVSLEEDCLHEALQLRHRARGLADATKLQSSATRTLTSAAIR